MKGSAFCGMVFLYDFLEEMLKDYNKPSENNPLY